MPIPIKNKNIFLATSGRIAPVPAGAVGTASSEGFSAAPSKTAKASKAPQFLQKLTSINARAGENVKFVSEFDAEPLPDISWNFNGKPLTGPHKVSLVPSRTLNAVNMNNILFQATQSGNKAILELSKVAAQQAGTYTVVLKNGSGSAQSEAKLNLQSR